MVSASYAGGLLSRAAWISSVATTTRDNSATYRQNAIAGIQVLQGWYEGDTGLWNTTGWWNAANCLTVLADFAALDPDNKSGLNIPSIVQNTYTNAQKTTVTATKVRGKNGNAPVSNYVKTLVRRDDIEKRGFDDFLNDYYDDEGWWALALIKSYDLGVQGLGDQSYLASAVEIFEDMSNGTSACGGIHWGKTSNYTNAIANELFLSVGASLANRATSSSKRTEYLNAAMKQWDWFKNSGLINSNNLINDGLDDDCKNNGETTWTYNQGVVLGGLVELYKATGDVSYLVEAQTIASAAINALSKNGTLYEGCEPNCGSDGAQFKGVFMRNLGYLQQVAPKTEYQAYILNNADTIWNNDRDSSDHLGPTWPGPYADATAGTQSSALDALVAAVAISS